MTNCTMVLSSSIDDEQAAVVGGDGFSHRIAALRRKRRSGNLAHAARLGVDLEDVDLAVVVGAGRLGAGHVDKIDGQGLRQLGAGSHQRSRQQAGCGNQQEGKSRVNEGQFLQPSRLPLPVGRSDSTLVTQRLIPPWFCDRWLDLDELHAHLSSMGPQTGPSSIGLRIEFRRSRQAPHRIASCVSRP